MNVNDTSSSDASQSLIVNNDPAWVHSYGSIQASFCNCNSDNQIMVKIIPQLFQCTCLTLRYLAIKDEKGGSVYLLHVNPFPTNGEMHSQVKLLGPGRSQQSAFGSHGMSSQSSTKGRKFSHSCGKPSL